MQYRFITHLRGLASLLVTFYHFCYFFWFHQPLCAYLSHTWPIQYQPMIAKIIDYLPVDLGQCGVGVFFIISGFLMPIVGQNKTRLAFIIGRVLRIWPAYVVALALTLLLVYSNGLLNDYYRPWKPGHLITAFLLVRDIGHYPVLDGIVWTLEIELKFYLFCGFVLPWLVNRFFYFIGIVLFVALASIILVWVGFNIHIIYLFTKFAYFLCLMSIGVTLSHYVQDKISCKTMIGACVILLGCFAAHNKLLSEMMSYSLSLLIFILCYWQRCRFKNHAIMQYLGDTSYSLYLIHGVPGFVIMYMIFGIGHSAILAIMGASLYAILITYVFYCHVERPVLQIKKRIVRAADPTS